MHKASEMVVLTATKLMKANLFHLKLEPPIKIVKDNLVIN